MSGIANLKLHIAYAQFESAVVLHLEDYESLSNVQAIGAIGLTAILGLAVSLSTFLVIGATSSVTYNGGSSL